MISRPNTIANAGRRSASHKRTAHRRAAVDTGALSCRPCSAARRRALWLTVPRGAGHAAGLKVSALVAGMVTGADSIADMAVLRHGGMGRLFRGVRAPSTSGTFLRSFRFGHVRQLDAVAARFLIALTGQCPLISGAEFTFVDIDDTIRSTYGYTKQGAGYGYSGVKGLNAFLAIASTGSSALTKSDGASGLTKA